MSTEVKNTDPLLTTEQAAAYMGCCSAQTLHAARCTKQGSFACLPYLKLGLRKVVYRKSAIDAFLDASVVLPAGVAHV